MKRIGIITHYYGSQNYGGLLQAYALCRKLREFGADAEQIQYIYYDHSANSEQSKKWTKKRVIEAINGRVYFLLHRQFYRNIARRSNAMSQFRDCIPHSSIVYNKKNISNANDCYDCFVTGSDQVWNLHWYDDAYFLTFALKPKFSYAASLGTDKLSKEEQDILRDRLADYVGISVREDDAVDILSPLVSQEVICSLDPTLLLNADEWNEICSDRLIQEPYLFSYFLGAGEVERNLATEYAKSHNLKIVTLPHLGGQRKKCDIHFGDIRLYDVSPKEFISLIKHSNCVFTDSFHACVFSNIYEKEFFCFARKGSESMSNRIESLGRLFQNEERFCNHNSRRNLDYLNSINGKPAIKLQDQKYMMESVNYLLKIRHY